MGKIEATPAIENGDIRIGNDDQSRNWFCGQVRDHAQFHVGGDLGDIARATIVAALISLLLATSPARATETSMFEIWFDESVIESATFGIFCLPDKRDGFDEHSGAVGGKVGLLNSMPEFHAMQGNIPAWEGASFGFLLNRRSKSVGIVGVEIIFPDGHLPEQKKSSFSNWYPPGEFWATHTHSSVHGKYDGIWIMQGEIENQKAFRFQVEFTPPNPAIDSQTDPCKTRIVG